MIVFQLSETMKFPIEKEMRNSNIITQLHSHTGGSKRKKKVAYQGFMLSLEETSKENRKEGSDVY